MHRSLRIVPLLALLVPLAACGGSGDDTAASGTGPIKIMTIASLESPTYSVPQVKTAVEAAVKAVNADGGIDGRDIEVSFCNDKFDPNEATACAQRAVADKVVAVVGGLTPHAGVIAPVLEAGNIPYIGPGGADAITEGTNKMFYPINAGAAAFVIGAGRIVVEKGGPSVVVVPMDNPTSIAGADLAVRGVKLAGGTTSQVIAPATAVDYNPTALKVLDKEPDGIVLTASGDTATRLVSAIRENGFTGPISGPASIVNPASIEALGSKADGIVLVGRGLPAAYTDNATIKEFGDQMRAIDPDGLVDDISLNSWLAVQALPGLLGDASITDGQSVVDAISEIEEPVSLLGIYPDYVGLASPPEKEFPRVSVFKVQASVITDGKITPDGDFYDPLAE